MASSNPYEIKSKLESKQPDTLKTKLDPNVPLTPQQQKNAVFFKRTLYNLILQRHEQLKKDTTPLPSTQPILESVKKSEIKKNQPNPNELRKRIFGQTVKKEETQPVNASVVKAPQKKINKKKLALLNNQLTKIEELRKELINSKEIDSRTIIKIDVALLKIKKKMKELS